jgi:tripartite-type tricarboxylate transporter receptor subunit TctC
MKTRLFKSKIIFSLCIGLALISLHAVLGFAQEDVAKFPSRPITFIIPIPPGGRPMQYVA